MAINTPMQGSAADLIKIAMLEIDKFLNNTNECAMLLQIHDELIFEVKKEKTKEYAKKIINIMENATNDVKLKVPIKVDAEVGNNWGETKLIEI